ncbi:hypothetical protein VWZ88_12580 [Phaeobacter sp. JH20_36]
MTLLQRIEQATAEMRTKREAMEQRQAERLAALDQQIADIKARLCVTRL